MTYSPVLIVHICGGIIGMLSGSAALFFRKGSRLHRASGKVFVLSMLSMAAAGAYVAFLKSQGINSLMGVFTCYLVATAWLTAKREEGETGLLEWGLLLVVLADGAAFLIFGWEAAHSATGLKNGDPAVAYFVFGSVAWLSAGSDVRMLIRGGISGARRIARHLWRMGWALFIAAGSFFIGTATDPALRQTGLRARLFTKAVRQTHLPEVPVLLIVVFTLYWLWRVRIRGNVRGIVGVSSHDAIPKTPRHDEASQRAGALAD